MRTEVIRMGTSGQGRDRRGLDRRAATTLMLAGLSSLAAGRASRAERFVGAPRRFDRDEMALSPPPSFGVPVPTEHRRAFPAAFPTVVQAVGGPLPSWAEPGLPAEAATFEIALVHAEGALSDQAGIDPRFRFAFVDEALGSAALPDVGYRIVARGADLQPAAEALFRLLHGDVLIGADLSDLLYVSSGGNPDSEFRPPPGEIERLNKPARAMVFDGLSTTPAVYSAIRDGLNGLAEAGFDGGVFVVALLSASPSASITLQAIDDMFTAVPCADRLCGGTAALEASRDAMVVFAFPRLA